MDTRRHDLFYGESHRALLEATFPGIVIEEAEDDGIHGVRLGVVIPEAYSDLRTYFRALMESGLHRFSLDFGLTSSIPGPAHDALINLLAEIKAERAAQGKAAPDAL